MRRILLVAALAIVIGVIVGGHLIWPTEPAASSSDSASAEPTPTVRRVTPANQIAYLGDSITDQARNLLQSQLDAEPKAIVAVGGKRIEEMEPGAHLLERRQPEQVVINLGTNNVLQGDSLDHEAAALQQVVDTFPQARCISLVTINEGMYEPPKDLYHPAVELNDRIRAMAGADPRIHIVDWAGIVRDQDAAHDPSGPITYDNVHPTAAVGQHLLVDAYQQAVNAC
jgi:hypothetical protein